MSTPEVARLIEQFAELAVQVAVREFGILLDYSPSSLADVDRTLDARTGGAIRTAGSPSEEQEFWTIAKVWGAYVGMVICRNLRGHWSIEKLSNGGTHAVLTVGTFTGSSMQAVYRRLTETPSKRMASYCRTLEALTQGRLTPPGRTDPPSSS